MTKMCIHSSSLGRGAGGEGRPRYRKIVYEAPFDKCDRVSDYRTAWAHFEALNLGGNA